MSRFRCGAWIAVVLSGGAICEAQDTVTIGGVDLPADCALARGEHPRLLFTKAGAILLGVLHYLTDERKYIDQATENMVPVEGVERPGQMGAVVRLGTTEYEVMFATDGPTGGHIRVMQAGQRTLDRPLASGVEDNYQKWAEDPRYEIWMTRPEYRNFPGKPRDREKGASP